MYITEKPIKKRYNLFLYFSTITVNLSAFSFGGACVWSSPAIPRLNGQIDPQNNPLQRNITSFEESWIASLLPLGITISVIICGFLADCIGRKNTLLLSSLPTIVGFAFLTFGNTINYFYIGRLLCGLGSGPLFSVLPIYVGEIAENSNRGILGCFLMFAITFGNLVTYILSPYVSLKVLSGSNLIAPIVFLIIFGLFVPESPHFYAKKGRYDLAKFSLLKLRYNDERAVKEELTDIINCIDEAYQRKINIKELFKDKGVVRSCCIALGLGCFQQWSGINVIFFYMQSIFEEANIGISSEMCVIIIGIIQFAATTLTLLLVDKFGRRILLLISAMGSVLSLFPTGIYFYLKDDTKFDIDFLSWLPIVTVSFFIISYSLGFGPITFAMIGEIFQPHVKAMAVTVAIFLTVFSTFCVTNIYPYMKDLIGVGLSFLLFALICFAAFIFIYLKVPETKGKSVQEIERLLRS